LRRDAYTESRVLEVITEYLDIIKQLYAEFDCRFNLLSEEPRQFNEELDSIIRKTARSELDARILLLIRSFNRNLLKTNFFKQTKLALSFRLKPDFLSTLDYPVAPFAVFFIVGAEFRGFHVRFSDIARGGIRMIRSTNQSAFAANVSSMFDENYNLALTQQKKNKDIPEGFIFPIFTFPSYLLTPPFLIQVDQKEQYCCPLNIKTRTGLHLRSMWMH
jgi:glutamate dehydrogenase